MTRTCCLTVLLALAGCTREPPARRPPTAEHRLPTGETRRIPVPVPAHPLPPAPAPPVEAVEVDSGVRTFEGPGIQVVVHDNQLVELHTTDQWDASVNQTFESCTFARSSLPTLRRSLSEDRVAVIEEACGSPDRGAARPRAR